MYKDVFVKSNRNFGTNRDVVKEIREDLAIHLAYGRRVLGYDGFIWSLYDFTRDAWGKVDATVPREWKKVPREKYDPLMYGELIIEQLLASGFLVIVQDVTPDEYEVQLALGTVIPGPLKICTIATCVTAVHNKIQNT